MNINKDIVENINKTNPDSTLIHISFKKQPIFSFEFFSASSAVSHSNK